MSHTPRPITRVRTLVVHDGCLLVMRRIRQGEEYYTLCGGRVEPGETPEQACAREVMEESTVDILVEREISRMQDIREGIPNTHIIYACAYIRGEPVLGGEELDKAGPDNQYLPMWLPLDRMREVSFKPDWLAETVGDFITSSGSTFPLIGPHEGRELELMLAGKKPAAMFYDAFPSREFIPDEQFAPYVTSGRILMKEVFLTSKKLNCVMSYVFYALPNEAWRLEELEKLKSQSFNQKAPDHTEIDRAIGRLLGYSEQAIEFFIARQQKRLTSRT